MDERLRAVVCDDDPVARQIARMVLDDTGYDVVGEAAMATEAIAMAGAARPDVVVLDLSMMGMTGLEAIPLLREQLPECDIVVFSAFEALRNTAREVGVSAIVDKTSSGELEAVLREIAARRTP